MIRIILNVKDLNEKENMELIEFEKNQNYNMYYDNEILDTCIDSMEELEKYPNLINLLKK